MEHETSQHISTQGGTGAEPQATAAPAPLLPGQRVAVHDYFDAYAEVHALSLTIASPGPDQ